MDNEIIITSDSTCDLSPALVQENDIRILPLRVILGADSFYDGIDVTPQDIFDYVDRTGELPKTAAPSIGEYRDFFKQFTDEGKTVIHKSDRSHVVL